MQSELIDFQKREYTTISGRKTLILSRNSIMASSDSEESDFLDLSGEEDIVVSNRTDRAQDPIDATKLIVFDFHLLTHTICVRSLKMLKRKKLL